MFRKNDFILITDKSNPYFLKVGRIDIIQDDTIVVTFRTIDKYGGKPLDEISFDEYELSIISKRIDFK